MKSTEYKSQDDTAPDTEGATSDGETSSEELDENDPQSQTEGFNFARLRLFLIIYIINIPFELPSYRKFRFRNLFPDLRSPLDRFRKHLTEQESELAPLKVWQFQALSLQAAESVMAAPPHEALSHFTNIAQNFPMQVNLIVTINCVLFIFFRFIL